jgi:hypothetical protein
MKRSHEYSNFFIRILLNEIINQPVEDKFVKKLAVFSIVNVLKTKFFRQTTITTG